MISEQRKCNGYFFYIPPVQEHDKRGRIGLTHNFEDFNPEYRMV